MTYEKYPLQIIILSNLLSILIYAAGIVIMQSIGWLYAGLYIALITIIEIRLLKFHCPNCYYYGKACAFGKGVISKLFFQKGNPEKFSCKPVQFKDLIPDLLIFAIPSITAIVLLILKFQWYILIAFLMLLLLNSMGNAYIRGQIACKNCIQKELGCPAAEYFASAK
jgi:hypothetical protein